MKPSPTAPIAEKAPHRRDARRAGLQYITEASPGITRILHGKYFAYQRPNGRLMRDSSTLHRIRSLVIPPAWEEVWICTKANGHIQATGRDARERKQYCYHPKWTEIRDLNKYDHMMAFGRALPLRKLRPVEAAVLALLQKRLKTARTSS